MKDKYKIIISGLLLVLLYAVIYFGVIYGFICNKTIACILFVGIMGTFLAPGFFIANNIFVFKSDIMIIIVMGVYLFLIGMLLTWLFLKIKRKLRGKR